MSGLDSSDNPSGWESPLTPLYSSATVSSLEEIPVEIIEPEYSKNLASLESLAQPSTVDLDRQTKVTELELEADRLSACTLAHVAQPEFTKITDLEYKIRHLPACTPDNVAQPEFTFNSKKAHTEPVLRSVLR